MLLFTTFLTTTLAGVWWVNKDPFVPSNFQFGLPYSLAVLSFLSAHEFGHYFAARYHNIKSTLPFFIPVPHFLINPFGTMGAVIRIRSPWPSRKALFDVGIAGPVAGFIVASLILAYGLLHLPPKEYLYSIHPEYRAMEKIPEGSLTLGDSILFLWVRNAFSRSSFLPPMNEIYHYPFLCAGWFGMFVTALNLLPVGQLDGGHVLYAIAGAKIQGYVGRIVFVALLLMGAAGFLPIMGIDAHLGTIGWLVWAAILFFLVKLDHPEIIPSDELSPNRKALGWIMFLVFFLTFTPIPIVVYSM